MIRVLIFTPLDDEQIPPETNSVNSVKVLGVQYMALYFRHLPIPASLDPANIFQIYNTQAPLVEEAE